MSGSSENQKQSRSSKVGLLLAGASAPRSFQKSLMDRDTTDQGLVTGLTMALSFVIGALTQDGLDTVSNKITEKQPKKSNKVPLLVSLGAVGAGIALQTVFRQRKEETMLNAGIRTSGNILSNVGVAGLTTHGLESIASKVAANKDERKKEMVYSLIVPVGALMAILTNRVLYRNLGKNTSVNNKDDIQPLKSIAISLGVLGFLSSVSLLERKTAKIFNSLISSKLPFLKNSYVPLGHLLSFGILSTGVYFGFKNLYKKIEDGANKMEDNFKKTPTSEFVSGSKRSFVNWRTLSKEGRRHIATRLSAENISKVLEVDKSKVKEPIRLYVGLDSAETEIKRVQLALDELKRTKAYSRKYIVIISPTGSGYVNYVMSDSVEYMSQGNCAQVTLQYSKRPSPLSLDRRDEGHIQYRMLINGIKKEILKLSPAKRPKLIIFGESLGAWTSQDAFMYEGTDGFEANLIDKALWIGTPAESKWKERTLSDKTLNTEQESIGVFNSYEDYLSLEPKNRQKVKYFMVTHYNDPVARFSTNLLVQEPEWLAIDEKRPPTVPSTNVYTVPGTFVQTLVDMKNALKPIPGKFVATGHDYRGDLAPFVSEVLEAKLSEETYNKILTALIENDRIRGKKTK